LLDQKEQKQKEQKQKKEQKQNVKIEEPFPQVLSPLNRKTVKP